MLKFNKVLLASDFDNTLVYTQGALERGEDIPPMSARNREAVEYFIQNGGYFSISTGRALPAFARYAKDLPCNAPCVIANGAALTIKKRNERDRITAVFYGDGASNEGACFEALNLAALWKLPILFVCINNTYGMSTPIAKAMHDLSLIHI